MKKVLIDLQVLDFIIENESNQLEMERVKSYQMNLIVYSQKEIYTLFFRKSDIDQIKHVDRVQEMIQSNCIHELEIEIESNSHILSAIAGLTLGASKFNPEFPKDIILLKDYPPFQREKFKYAELFGLIQKNKVDYFVTLNPFIKLDFIYLKNCLQILNELTSLKISVHL